MGDNLTLSVEDVRLLRERVVNILLEHRLDSNEDALIEAADDICEELLLDMGVNIL